MNPVTHRIEGELSADLAASMTLDQALNIGFEALSARLLSTAVSEIAMNAVRYAEGGDFSIQSLENGRGLEICVVDEGPGISDIHAALQDGVSTTPSSLGLGLGAARRAVDQFEILSSIGKGTTVRMAKWLPIPSAQLEVGIASCPNSMDLRNACGVLSHELFGDELLTAVYEGQGERAGATETAKLLENEIARHAHLTLAELVKHLDVFLGHNDRHATLALARIATGKLQVWSSPGTFVKLDDGSLVSDSGVSGKERLLPLEVTRSPNNVLFMGAGGLLPSLKAASIDPLWHLQPNADNLMDQFRARPDNAVLVLARMC